MVLLVISLLALVVGPLLFRLADRAHWALLALDGFIMVTVAGLVLGHVVPHSVAVAGPWALGMALVGFLGPGLIESHLHRAARSTHLATLILACIGLVVHEFFDGVALGLPAAAHAHGHGQGHDEGSILAMAVVLHRLPVAVTVWWLLRPVLGAVAAAGTLAGLGMATLAGFVFAGRVEPLMGEAWIGLLQCLVAGSLLHVVVHRPPPLATPSGPADVARANLYAGLGALVGMLAVAGISDDHEPFHGVPGEMHAGDTFLALALQSAPALLLGLLLAGLARAYLPQASPRWLRTGRAGAEALRGVVFGLPLSLRSYGVAPMYRVLVRGGVPLAAAMAFLAATPALGLEALAISLPFLGVELTVARTLAGMLVALCVGAGIGRLSGASGTSGTQETRTPEPAAPIAHRGGHGARLRVALGDLMDDVGPWLLLGLITASLIEPLVDRQWLAVLPPGVDVVLFTLLGLPLYVSATGATPLAAMLLHKGVSPGAVLAFLLVCPAVHLAVTRMLARMHGRQIALAFTAAVAGVAAILGWITNAVISAFGGALAGGPALGGPALTHGDHAQGPGLHHAVHQEPGVMAGVCLVALVAMLALSVLRLGPRGFVGQVLFPRGDADGCAGGGGHSHAHGDAHRPA
jgi:uncharacterized membrane protein YraQ (UPF0718 family)